MPRVREPRGHPELLALGRDRPSRDLLLTEPLSVAPGTRHQRAGRRADCRGSDPGVPGGLRQVCVRQAV